ncbi:NAD-dependent epimerase/dehydratase family protein [Roseivirga seohaensis]|uniref:NAD-dependent epimerase/dehydratase family protein n=1 Tax=Roseivirga seohaensis TaxID=1914963 RepID=UPI00069E9D4D|nr:NAD-dependent epimerase/dehydratase family protein [Roseivirga seohaensis]
MRNIVITGVAGLIGSRMADWIAVNHSEYNIIGIDDLSGGYIENVNPNVEFHQVDCKSAELKEIFAKYKPEIVYHFAAYAAEGLSPFIRNFNYQNNLLSTSNIINECIRHGVRRLVFTSSMAVYGNGTPPFDEQDIPAPIDPYGIAKYACEMDIQVAGEQHGLDWCIIRPHNVYGIKQNIWDTYRNVLGIWMTQYLNDEPMSIFGDGEQKRAFSFVDDCLEPLWKAATDERASKKIINLGSSVYHSINEANEILKRVIGKGETIYKEARHEVKNAHPTWQRSVELLDYKDNTSLEEGLTIMWDWAKNQPLRERFRWSEYELENGIYDFWKKPEIVANT